MFLFLLYGVKEAHWKNVIHAIWQFNGLVLDSFE